MKITVVPNSNNNLDRYTKVGAQAFIFGLEDFCINYPSLSINEIKALVDTFKDVDIFISINKTIFNSELKLLEQRLIELNEINIKGILFYDLSVLSIYHKYKFHYSIGWHQTHMVTNYNTCNYYYDKGVEYGILSSEITKDEMIDIRHNTSMKLFVFLIGRPIMAHSKRKLLTNYYESLNKEYDFKLKAIEEHDKSYLVKETVDGTCIFESDIVNGIDYLLDLNKAGIEYGIIHGFNIDDLLLEKLISLTKNVLDNNSKSSTEEIKRLIGNNTGFFDKKTVFKVKKDEKKN